MPYTLEHRVLPEYLEVHIKGTILPGEELKEAIERWEKVARLCVKEDRHLILAFMDLEGQHSLDSKYNLVDSATSFGWRPEYKLSMVIKKEALFNHLLFTETVMKNLGFEMKIFRKKREGIKWLLT